VQQASGNENGTESYRTDLPVQKGHMRMTTKNELTFSVPEAGQRFLGLSRNGSYAAANRGRHPYDQDRPIAARPRGTDLPRLMPLRMKAQDGEGIVDQGRAMNPPNPAGHQGAAIADPVGRGKGRGRPTLWRQRGK